MDLSQDRKKVMQYFKTALMNVGEIDDSVFEVFFGKTSIVEFKKNKFLIEPGQQEDYIYFIIDGAVIVYVHEGDVDYVTNIRFSNQFTSALTSFLTRRLSRYYIKTIVDSKFLAIAYDDLQDMYKTYPQVNTLGRLTMERLLLEKRQRELDFMILSAEARYQKLLENHPEYLLSVKQKHLASFLGITPQSLSRIRKKLSES